MLFIASLSVLALSVNQAFAGPVLTRDDNAAAANVTTCNGKLYTYEELAGYGKLVSDARDKFGDTIGGIGSAIAFEKKSWKYKKGSYEGVVWGLPDRGWNTQGTQNTQTRIHKFSVVFTPVEATLEKPASPNFQFSYVDTLLLTGPDGTPLTGLDPTETITYPGFPTLPLARYTGNGFGQNGTGGARVPLDTEGLVLGDDKTFWISDEYAAYVYQFDKKGKMIKAVRTPEALVPRRNGTESFNAASPPIYDPDLEITPEDPDSGRGNNQGLEALTASPDGKYLYTMLQSATIQDGGSSAKKRRNTRLLKYRVKDDETKLEAEYAVQLPVLPTGRVASQSEMHYISETQFLVLARDSNAGHGAESTLSIYRNADVIDISKATNVAGTAADDIKGQIASKDGVLKSSIVSATYCPWLSFNNNDQLGRFGLHNGGEQDANLLNEKWESFAMLPVDKDDKIGRSKRQDEDEGKQYYLVSFSDNDFITQNGYINFGQNKYVDASGYNLDNQVLVFKVKLPKGANPL
ncbi:uncharacterized protein J4E92_010810 [Alternaria infectoria]|uniref:uncharacterized protein n=1 Tax=Alternaria infectoria TaxID=45303 RepID=UPI00221FA1C1|nr:uncharacterized protein J4E92_010810 [Alternaria infectoria]KAI4908617.1 hypothetical protein J4E92_010810 [Alternaria infectoria]